MENQSFTHNFDRNFSNIITDHISKDKKYVYYSDTNGANVVKIDTQPYFNSYPEKYLVDVNHDTALLITNEIKGMLNDIKAIQISEQQYKSLSNMQKN
jgi:hypothetical protein